MSPDTQVHVSAPKDVPATLTAPSPAFRRHAWLAVLSLLGFVLVYLGLTVWLGSVIYHFLRDGLRANLFIAILECIIPALMFFVLVRGLIAVKRGKDPAAVELLPSDEPRLFAFIYELADRAGAPRPHRVFLSSAVQAGVAFDLSILNLLIPTKKNLIVGLGLINVLSVSEFAAVLAHEFGHFAQRSMAVGRWVYMAEQIAGHIALHRGKLDRFLDGVSVQDPRIAWIGWVLRLCLWSVRSVLDTVFLLVTMVHRALSREMELQADLVAASLTGSDALVHALHKTHSADASYGAALDLAIREYHRGFLVKDLFTLQTRQTENLRRVCDDPTIGVPPVLPTEGREKHRVFKEAFAQPSAMWSTHPPDREREDNLKKIYLPCDLDDRSGWVLFQDPAATRARVTSHLLDLYAEDLAKRAALEQKAAKTAPIAPSASQTRAVLEEQEALAKVDAVFQRAFHSPVYRGVYLGRDLTRSARGVEELFDPHATISADSLPPAVTELYPQEQRKEIESWREVLTDYHTLKGLLSGRLKKTGRLVRFRGEEVPHSALEPLLQRVGVEKTAAEQKVADRDRYLRGIHQQMAVTVGKGWAAYHRSLVALVHYAEHTAADIGDVDGYLSNVIAIVTADGHVSQSEMRQLQVAAQQAFDVLARSFQQAPEVLVPPRVLEKLCKALSLPATNQTWVERLGAFTLSAPYVETLGQWIAPAQTWFRTVAVDFAALADAAVEELLETETMLYEAMQKRSSESPEVPDAPEAGKVPSTYVTILPGQERERQTKLGLWDRVMISDGLVPGALRATVAVAMLGGLALLGRVAADHKVVVFNGLNARVTVIIGATRANLGPHQSASISVGGRERVTVRTVIPRYNTETLVEQFDEDVSNSQATFVYNIARAALMYEQTIIYRTNSRETEQPEPHLLANPRWFQNDSNVRFAPPPQTASVSRGASSATRRVLNAATNASPREQVALLPNQAAREVMVRAHLTFDEPGGVFFQWLSTEATPTDAFAILSARAEHDTSMALQRVLGGAATGADKGRLCEQHRQRFARTPDADAAYLVATCIDDPEQQRAAIERGRQQYPAHPYFAWGAGFRAISRGQWAEARRSLEIARAEADLRPSATLLLARVMRVQWAQARYLAEGPVALDFARADIDSLAGDSQDLRDLLNDEHPQRNERMTAIQLLAAGNGADAVAQTVGRTQRNGLLFLAACSDNAQDTLVQEAMAEIDHDRVGPTSTWMVAVMVRERGVIPAVLEASVQRVGPKGDLLLWLNALKHGEQVEPPPSLQYPMAITMGVMMLGQQAPASWRAAAQGYFFQSERPFFLP